MLKIGVGLQYRQRIVPIVIELYRLLRLPYAVSKIPNEELLIVPIPKLDSIRRLLRPSIPALLLCIDEQPMSVAEVQQYLEPF